MKDIQLNGCINYLKNLVVVSKLVGGISDQALLELSVKYLEELKGIKEKGV